MTDTGPALTTADEPVQALRCPRCDVTWRGTSRIGCWCCGGLGRPNGEVRIVAD